MYKELHDTSLKTSDIRLFEEMYNTYYPVLYNYAASITKEQTLAEDAVSEVFLKLWETRNSIAIGSLKSYLFKSVYHQCLNQLKHLRIQDKYRDFFHLHPPLGEDDSLSGVLENEINDILQKTIEQLPKQCQKIFIMSRIEGMKHEEIAQKLGVSVNTVRMQVHRALKKLWIELKDYLLLLLFFIYN